MAKERQNVVRLNAAFVAHYDAVLSYARRRSVTTEDAEEVAAATYLTAWRRVTDMPVEPDTLRWLYGVARRNLANERRSSNRRGDLAVKLTRQRADPAPNDADDARIETVLRDLRPDQQAILRLSSWEGVTYAEGAVLLTCSPNAYAIRLHRARAALKKALASADADGARGDSHTRARRAVSSRRRAP